MSIHATLINTRTRKLRTLGTSKQQPCVSNGPAAAWTARLGDLQTQRRRDVKYFRRKHRECWIKVEKNGIFDKDVLSLVEGFGYNATNLIRSPRYGTNQLSGEDEIGRVSPGSLASWCYPIPFQTGKTMERTARIYVELGDLI